MTWGRLIHLSRWERFALCLLVAGVVGVGYEHFYPDYEESYGWIYSGWFTGLCSGLLLGFVLHALKRYLRKRAMKMN